MAKNTVKKVQRIAHNKTYNEDHEMLSEGNDLLFGIFEEMKKNNDLTTIHLNSFETNLSEKSKTFNQQKIQTDKITIPSQNHQNVPKSKTFGLSRKFPLMEKCTRALKQIKHNRQMPKPRAHLAGLSNSPKPKAHHVRLSNSLSFLNNLVSDAKLKKIKVVSKNPKDSNNSRNQKVTEKLDHYRAPTYIKNNFTKQLKNKEIPSKKCESDIVKKKNEENSHLIGNNSDKIIDNSSDTDDYEKFIKKFCPKKSKNKNSKKKSTKVIKKRISKPISSENDSDMTDDEVPASSKTNKKILKKSEAMGNRQSTSKGKVTYESNKVRKKRKSKTVSKSESDSDTCDKSSSRSYTRSKKIKRSHSRLSSSKEDSQYEMDIVNDGVYHDSSSESDDLPSLSEAAHGFKSNSYTFSSQSSDQSSLHNPMPDSNLSHRTSDNCSLDINKNMTETLDTVSVVSTNFSNTNNTRGVDPLCSNEVKPILPNKTLGIALSVNSDQQNISHKTPIIPSLVSSAQPNASNKTSSTVSLVNNDFPIVLNKMSNISSLIDSGTLNKECFADKKDSVLNSSRQGHFNKNTIVDLTESDNECESSFTVMPKIVMTSGQIPNDSQSYSEESDIELLDVIVAELPKESKAKCSDKDVTRPNDATNKLIKTEKADQALSCSNAKAQNIPELQTSLKRKYETAYSTGICQGYDKIAESKDTIISQLNLNKPKNSTVSNAENSLILSKNVKKEPCDDCEIVLDINSNGNPNLNLPAVQICNNTIIKTEKYSKTDKKVASNSVSKSGCNTIKLANQSSFIVNNSENSVILSKNVKKEPCDDDCEIVFDVSSSNNDKNLHTVQINNDISIKAERDSKALKQVAPVNVASNGSIATQQINKLSQNEKKLHGDSCSNFKNLSDSSNKHPGLLRKEGIVDPDTISIKVLLQELKKEFATYQDILQTEQSVENTFKLLEKCQAEKLVSLKSKLTQFLESTPGNSDCNSIKTAVDKLLDSSSLKDCSKVPPVCHNISSNISVKDLKTFATMNIVPLSSISENDIKPNLSELQFALKQEARTSDEINSMSFGEKCVVCAKDASAACQQCAKVFFCSNECGRKYWEDGHKNACIK